MLNIIKNKSKFILPIIIVVCLLGVAITYAANQDKTGTITNNFTAGEITTEIEEKPEIANGVVKKNPSVVNKGPNDALIRMRVNMSPSKLAEFLKGVTADGENRIDWSNEWYYNEDDGFWYYRHIVPAGGKTTELFTRLLDVVDAENKVTDVFEKEVGSIDEFQITLYQEAVQTVLYDENGEPIKDGDRIADVSDLTTNADIFADEQTKENALYIWELYESNK